MSCKHIARIEPFYKVVIMVMITFCHFLTMANSPVSGSSAAIQSECATNELEILGNRFFCEGQSTTLTAQNYVSYRWSDGTNGANINVLSPGSYTVTATAASGCYSTATVSVAMFTNPTVSISGGNTTICEGTSVTLIATSNASSLQWNTGAQTSYLQVSEMGSYTVTATNNNGCTAQATSTVLVNAKPDIDIVGDTNICQGSNGQLLVYSSELDLDYYWLTTQQTTANIQIAPTSNTTYIVRATDNFGCSATSSIFVRIRENPTVSINGANYFCEGDTVSIFAASTYPIVWNDGTTTSEKRVTEEGIYSVTATTPYSCATTVSKNVVAEALPIITIAGNTSICEGENTEIEAQGAVSYQWSNGSNNAVVYLSEPGNYSVKGVSALGCEASYSFPLEVKSNPVFEIVGGNTAFCANETHTLLAVSDDNLQYEWDNDVSTAHNEVSEPGTYTVVATATNGCSALKSTELSTLPPPTVQITGDQQICSGDRDTLTASGAVSYIWSNGMRNDVITVSPVTSSTYTVVGTDERGCSDEAELTINVLPKPIATITGESEFCFGDTLLLNSTSSSQILWSTGETTTTKKVTRSGIYTVTLTNSSGCYAVASKEVTALPIPITTILGENEVCGGETAELSIVDEDLNCEWNTESVAHSIIVEPVETTTYFCDLTNDYGCSYRAHKTVVVIPTPEVEMLAPEFICEDEVATLSVSQADLYLWNTGETTSQITIEEGGYYSVIVTQNGCQASNSVMIDEIENPNVLISGNATFCQGEDSELVASGGDSYLWNTGGEDASIAITETGLYSVVATNNYGCSAETSMIVNMLSAPIVEISGDDQICNGETVVLTASGENELLWSNGEVSPSIEVQPEQMTNYSVIATSENGCSTEAQFTINVHQTSYQLVRDSICEDDDYARYGFVLPVQETPGIFHFTQNLFSVHGCDSVVELELKVKPKPIFNTRIQGPEFVTEAGTYSYFVLDAVHGNGQYEWHISNPYWSFQSHSTVNTAQLVVNEPGTGNLTVYAFNECGSTPTLLQVKYSPVGINEATKDDAIVVYPNPASEILTVKSNQIPISNFVIYDLLGKIVMQGAFLNNEQTIEINSLENGNYFLQLWNDKTMLKILKFVKN